MTDPDIKAEAVFENIHDEILGECELEFTNPRILDKVNGHSDFGNLMLSKLKVTK